jgi:hypothetical protein
MHTLIRDCLEVAWMLAESKETHPEPKRLIEYMAKETCTNIRKLETVWLE